MEKHRHTGSRESLPLDSSRTQSPLRRKSLPIDAATSRKPRPPSSSDDHPNAPTRGLWPSSSSISRRSGTLADHLGNDRLIDLAHRRSSPSPTAPEPPVSISRQRSCSEFRSSLDIEEDQSNRADQGEHDGMDDRRKIKKKSSKENHRPLGGSMRYIGNKLHFPRSSKPDSPPSAACAPTRTAARISVDENALASSRRKSDFLLDIPSFESDRSDNVNSKKIPNPRAPRSKRNDHQNEDKNHESKSVEMNPTMKPAPRRTSSGSAWALSPGRRASSPPLVDGSTRPAAAGLRSFSSLRPPSPGRGKGGGGVGNILSLGLDLFRKKSGSPSLTSSSSFGNGSPKMVTGEAGHQFKIAYNRLMQWRFVNARSDASSRTKADTAQAVMTCAWVGLAKLQASVAQKQLQLQKEKQVLKINTMVYCQVKLLDRWNDTERHYVAALSTTRDSLQSVVCRLPIVEGAKAEPQHISAALRQANDLTSTIKTTVGIFSPMNLEMVPLLSELAQVATEEKSLLEEASELLGLISSLQLQEESLKCHLIQLNSGRSTEHVLPARNAIATA